MKLTNDIKIPSKQNNNGCRLSGNLYISKDILEDLSDSSFDNLVTTLKILQKQIKATLSQRDKDLFKIAISKNRELCATYKNEKLDFFIVDSHSNVITQALTMNDITKIEWKETQIIQRANSYSLTEDKSQERKENILLQTLVSSSYRQKNSFRGPPPIFGMQLQDDVILDTEEEKKDEI